MDPTDGGLDAMLAAMQGEATESADQVQERVTALIDAVNRPQGGPPPPVVPPLVVPPLVVPPLVVPPPVFVLDSVQYATFGPSELDYSWVKDSTDGGIVELIIRSGGYGFNTADLETHVSKIKSVYRPSPAHAAVPAVIVCEDEVVQQLTACQPSLADLRTLVGDQKLDVPSPQAAAVICFHKTYPQVWPQLKKANVQVLFDRHTADARGGGFFDNNTIYMSKLLVTPAGAFVRLLVHEIGHALFEMKLLNHKKMPHRLDADKLTDLSQPVPQAALRERSEECGEVQRFWDSMSDLAMTFYQAWRTLRQSRGVYLLGIDLWADPKGNRLSPGQRRQYQAGNFGEFCAEVFMLYAMGDLQAHVLAVLAADEIQPDVKTAWKNAWHVLQAEAAPILVPRSVV